MRQIRTAAAAMIALTVSVCSGSAVARQAPKAEVMPLGLRGVYFVENQGQWSDASVEYGFKTRGLDIAFRESSFTMHLSREVSRNVPVEVAVDPTDGAWASRPYEYQVVERASRPYESATVPEASLKHERGFFSFDDSHPLPHGRGSSGKSVEFEHLTLTVTFPGSNPATPRSAQPQAAKFNYYIGDDESRWASNVLSFGAIVYENLYDGVNLFICGNDDGVLKYEFHVAPGADWNQIRIAYDGIDSLCVEESGDLRIATSFGTLMDSAPLVWQEDAAFSPSLGFAGEGRGGGDFSRREDSTSRARPSAVSSGPNGEEAELDVVREAPLPDSRGSSEPTIPARFELVDARTYRFALDGVPDSWLPLVIDPEIEWMCYLGGSNLDDGQGVAADSSGNALVTGSTRSIDFAGRNNSHYGGYYDAFALKVDPSGQLLWMTYLGGSDYDFASGISVDSAGNALVTGITESADFAGRNNSHYGRYHDAFALKVNPSGQLEWMTYLGGSDDDYGRDIAADGAGNALVTGETRSTDFAGRNNSNHGGSYDFDAFALKVSPLGQLQWMTYLGGSTSDVGYGIAVDSAGNALVTGDTLSTDFAGRNNSHHGAFDAFALKVNPSGQLEWMTYLGGSASDFSDGIAVDGAGDALVTGTTGSTDFAGRNNSHHGTYDAYALKVNPSGQLLWMTYLGGSGGDEGFGIAVNSAGDALVTGDTLSTDFAGRNNSHHGFYDAFALKVSPSGQLEWVTYLGGSGGDRGCGVAVDGAGNALVTGYTESTDFEGRNNSHYGGGDAFIVKPRFPDTVRLTVDATCPRGGTIQIEWSGATPESWAALVFASQTGTVTLPPSVPCGGTILGLGSRGIQVVWTGDTGEQGARRIGRFAGPGACGGYLQLLDLTTCATSNVARIE